MNPDNIKTPENQPGIKIYCRPGEARGSFILTVKDRRNPGVSDRIEILGEGNAAAAQRVLNDYASKLSVSEACDSIRHAFSDSVVSNSIVPLKQIENRTSTRKPSPSRNQPLLDKIKVLKDILGKITATRGFLAGEFSRHRSEMKKEKNIYDAAFKIRIEIYLVCQANEILKPNNLAIHAADDLENFLSEASDVQWSRRYVGYANERDMLSRIASVIPSLKKLGESGVLDRVLNKNLPRRINDIIVQYRERKGLIRRILEPPSSQS